MSYIDRYPVLKDLLVADLGLSDLNPRKEFSDESIEALAESIKVCGLMQNLMGLVVGEHVLIVAGGRRLRALQLLAERGEGPEMVPVLLTDDVELARTWSGSENEAREELHPADQLTAYATMARAGQGVPQIAAAFGVTERHVQRRLKLAALDDASLQALRAGEINPEHAQALLLCNSEDQRAKELERARQGVSAASLRRDILHGQVTSDDRRALFVGMAAYRAAGGAISSDLFSSDVVIEDVTLLDHLFAEKVAQTRDAFIEAGWRWAEFCPDVYVPYSVGDRCDRIYPKPVPFDEASEARYAALENRQFDADFTEADRAELRAASWIAARKHVFTDAQRSVAGLWFCVQTDGRVRTLEGYVRREDRAEAVAQGVLRETKVEPAIGTDAGADEDGEADRGFSAALLADLRAVRLSALQEAILNRPQLARVVLAYGLACDTHARPLDVMIHTQPNAPKTDDGFRQAELLDDLPVLRDWEHANRLPLDELTQIITLHLLSGLRYGFGYGETRPEAWGEVLKLARPDMRERWRPTKDNFFSRVTSAYLTRLYCHIFGLGPAHHDAREFDGMKKGEKANLMHMLFDPNSKRATYRLMTDTALAKIEAWVPEFD